MEFKNFEIVKMPSVNKYEILKKVSDYKLTIGYFEPSEDYSYQLRSCGMRLMEYWEEGLDQFLLMAEKILSLNWEYMDEEKEKFFQEYAS